MRVGLDEQDLDGVGAGGPAQQWLALVGELNQRAGELGRVAALLTVHALPGSNVLFSALGIIVDRGLGITGGLRREELGPEEAGLYEHRADAEGRNFGREGLDPALHPEL
jgi:hypothetical protein